MIRELKMIGGWDNEDPEMQAIFMARGPGSFLSYVEVSNNYFSIQSRTEDRSHRDCRRIPGDTACCSPEFTPILACTEHSRHRSGPCAQWHMGKRGRGPLGRMGGSKVRVPECHIKEYSQRCLLSTCCRLPLCLSPGVMLFVTIYVQGATSSGKPIS